jgi:hypothetical protein
MHVIYAIRLQIWWRHKSSKEYKISKKYMQSFNCSRLLIVYESSMVFWMVVFRRYVLPPFLWQMAATEFTVNPTYASTTTTHSHKIKTWIFTAVKISSLIPHRTADFWTNNNFIYPTSLSINSVITWKCFNVISLGAWVTQLSILWTLSFLLSF